jgi:hypothetical protein
MAGDENEASGGASEHEGPPATVKPETPKPTTKGAASEWTASDVRGPLNAAGATPADTTVGSASSASPGSSATSSRVEPARASSKGPIAVGIIVGAIIGAGSAYAVYAAKAGDTAAIDQKIAALNGRIGALDSRVGSLDPKGAADEAVVPLKTSLADLAKKVAGAETLAKSAAANADAAKQAAAHPPAPPPAPAPDLSALRDKVASLGTALDALEKRDQGMAASSDLKTTQDRLAGAETALAGLKTQIGDVGAQVGDAKSQIGAVTTQLGAVKGAVGAVSAAVAELQKQATATAGDVQALRAGQKALEGKITNAPALAVVSDSLIERIDRGQPFTAQVNALEALGVDPAKIAVLRLSADQGVPSAMTLGDKFAPLADVILATPGKTPTDTGFWDRMKGGIGGLVSVHRVDDVSADDNASKVARIKVDLSQGDVIGAYKAWTALPAEAKTSPQAATWGALAKTHFDAITAANAIQAEAIATLGAKKS